MLQIRTMSKHFWATIEHSQHYKYNGEFPELLCARLKRAAVPSFMLAMQMSDIRVQIQVPQHLFVTGMRQQPYSELTEASCPAAKCEALHA